MPRRVTLSLAVFAQRLVASIFPRGLAVFAQCWAETYRFNIPERISCTSFFTSIDLASNITMFDHVVIARTRIRLPDWAGWRRFG